jgi:hypothetical protein
MSDQNQECGILFTYSIQRLPNPGTRHSGIYSKNGHPVLIEIFDLPFDHLEDDGRPVAEALWFAENEFLERIGNLLHPDDRLISWQAHLASNPAVMLSEYRVLLPARNY